MTEDKVKYFVATLFVKNCKGNQVKMCLSNTIRLIPTTCGLNLSITIYISNYKALYYLLC